MIVSDGDISNNAAYELVLENIENAEGVFSVYPENAVGRTPVIIRVADPARLDYEMDTGTLQIFTVFNCVPLSTVISLYCLHLIALYSPM
jgi:hypothetical protein